MEAGSNTLISIDALVTSTVPAVITNTAFPSGDGNDRVTEFDVAEDIIVFQILNGTTYDPLLDTSNTAEGALISYVDGSSILLEGVDMADLTAANFLFDDTLYAVT